MTKPHIKTAVPKRRYEIDNFSVLLLGDIESTDPVNYKYIMAFVDVSETEPMMYIISEENPPNQREHGRYRVRVLYGHDERDMGSDEFPGDLDQFTEYGMQLASRLLQLTEEEPIRLL
ncbi:MAG TPA: hypothetical protein EYP34_10015 [Chromatiaceae bacterium]|nr:hypothetical protein [Chromatiaceae bacterium]